MNGGHDLGGRQGFGSVNAEPESEEPLFHAEWERRILRSRWQQACWVSGILMNHAMPASVSTLRTI